MNYLAHSYLSFRQPELIVGNYLGDFLRNREVEKLPVKVRKGLILHRKIDSFTDVHPVVKEGTRLLHKSMGKYAPVVLDIYFDFLLSKRWHDFHEEQLSDFCAFSYQALMQYQEAMSERIAIRMQKMVADRWLENYQTYSGLKRVFYYLAKRAKFNSNLANAPEILELLEDELERIFLDFFPDIIVFVRHEIMTDAASGDI